MAAAKLLSRCAPLESGKAQMAIGVVVRELHDANSHPRIAKISTSSQQSFSVSTPQSPLSHHTHEPRCRACRSTSLRVDYAQGDRVCTHCGVVNEERLLDDRPEWREYLDADDGGGGSALARCGMVPVDESLYAGGLQPTTLSRHLYGGPTVASASTSPSSSAPRQLQLRQRLAATARRIDRRMAQLSARSMDAARWHHRASQARQKRHLIVESEGGSCDGGTDGETTHDEDDERDNADLRPEYEQLLLQEEEDAARVNAALYADKWSLSRAIQLYGTDHEVSLLESIDALLVEEDRGAGDAKKKEGRLDATLRQASRDLYRAYSMLLQSAGRLQLPERVQGEAVAWLCRYAALRDGLAVRGVSSAPKRLLGDRAAPAAGRTSRRHERMARAAIGECNKAKQAGALCAALIFYSCRCQGWPRPLEEVCASVQPLPDGPDIQLSSLNPQEPFVQKKHCSRAMNDVRQAFPELSQRLAALTNTESSANAVIPAASMDPESTLANLVEHKVRQLQLPPVAEAVVQSLACHWQHQQKQGASEVLPLTDAGKWSALCAALTLFACHAGSVMQRLAVQASNSKRRKLANGFRETLPESFDVFDASTAGVASAEQRAYEMGRVWDAWCEQTPWSRSVSDVERSFRVPASSILDVYRKQVFPERVRLLCHLRDSVAAVDGEALLPTALSRDSLRGTPLSSVLLPLIPVVSALLNEDATQQA